MDEWIVNGRDSEIPCGLGVLALCKFWAACAVVGVAAAVIVDRLLGRDS